MLNVIVCPICVVPCWPSSTSIERRQKCAWPRPSLYPYTLSYPPAGLQVFDAFLAPISPPPSFCTATSPFSGAAPPTGDEPYDPSATVANHGLMVRPSFLPCTRI
jgi:hypothetical protein